MLNKKAKRILRSLTSVACAASILVAGTCAYAAEDSKALEKKTSELQDEIDDMNKELDDLSAQMDDTSAKIEESTENLEKAELDLAAAKLNEENQYEAMKERIKFMYEGGNLSLVQVLLSSESMGEFLNNAEYISTISDYDREMLDEFEEISKNVEEKQQALQTEQENLSNLQTTLDSQKKTLKEKISSTEDDLSDYKDQLARAKAAEEAASAAESSEVVDTEGQVVSADTSTVALLAGILECEAGISYDGMIAVGTVIMNRVASPGYPDTIKDVIYQSGQFSPVSSGKLDKVLKRGPSSSAYKAAKAVLNGQRNAKVKKCLHFWASYTGRDGIVVGDNVFW